MKLNRILGLLGALALVLGCSAPGTPEDAPRGAAAETSELSEGLARGVIDASPEFRIEQSRIHVFEHQMQTGIRDGLWSFRRWKTDDGLNATAIDLAPEARSWLESAEYNVGGVVRLYLSQPIGRRVIAIQDSRNIGAPLMNEIDFHWEYTDVPDEVAALKPELRGGPYRGVALLQYQEDSWKVVGDVVDYRVPL